MYRLGCGMLSHKHRRGETTVHDAKRDDEKRDVLCWTEPVNKIPQLTCFYFPSTQLALDTGAHMHHVTCSFHLGATVPMVAVNL